MTPLETLLADDLEAGSAPAAIAALADEIRRRHGSGVRAVLFYGSCRRRASVEGLADLLVLVDSYRAVHHRPLARLFNRLLPPNVYYLELADGGEVQRCKYAVVSLAAFERRCARGLDAYFRARFCQPCGLLWVADAEARQRVVRARAVALTTFAAEFAPLVAGHCPSLDFWQGALAASYRCELRPEPPDTAARLVRADAGYYRAAADAVLPALPWVSREGDGWRFSPTRRARWHARLRWGLRRPWGKTLNVLRLLKAAGTFSNGIDYVLWKIERHSGVRIEASDRMRRYPRLSAIGLAWKVWRRRVLQ